MKPKYFIENAYSIYPKTFNSFVAQNYEIEAPETEFEWNVLSLFRKGKTHLFHEEYSLAYNCFKELSHLILKTVHPTLPSDPNTNYYSEVTYTQELLDPIMVRSAELLRDGPLKRYNFPAKVVDKNKRLAPAIAKKIDKLNGAGLVVRSHHGKVQDLVEAGVGSAKNNQWKSALNSYTLAFKGVPVKDTELRATLSHDMAIINEKLNNKTAAIKLAENSVSLFGTAKNREKEVQALSTLSGLLSRNNKPAEAKRVLDQANDLIKRHNLHPINVIPYSLLSNGSRPIVPITASTINPFSVLRNNTPLRTASSRLNNGNGNTETENNAKTPSFISMEYLLKQTDAVQKNMNINGQEANVAISLSGDLKTNMKNYYTSVSKTEDIGILTAYLATPTQMVAYLPHMYFYVIPMAMADCEIGLGKLSVAVARMINVLKYPYLNAKVEVINIWKKLADCYLDLGDEAYKNAKDDQTRYASAKHWYERIVKTNNKIDVNSPLYKNSKFSGIKKRVQNILAGPASFISLNGVTTLNENPAILWRLREAQTMLFQIQSKLNYYGFDKDYIPPFDFDYLQTTASYFAQHAAQMEQKYIQYKSTAENEELRSDQMGQQVELAQESVLLELRGVSEAQAGIDVAVANRNYAETRRKNAVDAKNEFHAVRWELLEYTGAEAWANASSVDRDDQVKLTWNGHHYNSHKKRRNVVIKELAYRKTRITHNLQANKLADEVAAAGAYKAVAEAQLVQAKARKRVAEQRVEIARLQQKQAEENKEFLDLKEFGAGMWYKLARKTKRLVVRYLNQATEISMLMERAYNAETERGLNVIRYNYAPSYSGFLVGADQLTRDIDYFTYDYLTNIKSKKAPVKKTISLGDLAPDAFEKLLSKGHCQFETTLADFDREYPGMYLCKIKNVELVFVGITRAVSIAGSLRNVGVSKFKQSNGTVISRLYPADVMPLSQYDIRQDALAFRFDPKDLKLFENNGLETIWELRLGKDANDFDFREILDIHLIIYYDGFHNTTLESSVIANLPAGGEASRAFSMQLYFPDELYYLRTNGEGILEFDAQIFPYNQVNLKRKSTKLKVLGEGGAAKGLTLKVKSKVMNKTLKVTTNQKGMVTADKLKKLKNGSMLDKWTVNISKADNPQLVKNNKLDLSGIKDLIFLVEYDFKYNS